MPGPATKILDFLKVRLGVIGSRYNQHQARKKLRLRETLSLGEKRFLAVVEYRHQEIVIAGTASTITVLTTSSPLDAISVDEGCISKNSLQ